MFSYLFSYVTSAPLLPPPLQVAVMISYLKSYEHMGIANISCHTGCECNEQVRILCVHWCVSLCVHMYTAYALVVRCPRQGRTGRATVPGRTGQLLKLNQPNQPTQPTNQLRATAPGRPGQLLKLNQPTQPTNQSTNSGQQHQDDQDSC